MQASITKMDRYIADCWKLLLDSDPFPDKTLDVHLDIAHPDIARFIASRTSRTSAG